MFRGVVVRMTLGAVLCVFAGTGCASMGALVGAPYKKDSVDKFHDSAKELYDAVNGTKAELRGVRKSIGLNLADGSPPTVTEVAEYVQRVSQVSVNIKKAMTNVPKLLTSGKNILLKAPKQYAGPNLIHLPVKLKLIKEAIEWLTALPDEANAVGTELASLGTCFSGLESGNVPDACREGGDSSVELVADASTQGAGGDKPDGTVGRPAATHSGSPSEETGALLKSFVLPDANGKPFDVATHAGKDVIVLAFWATWCKPCKLELAAINKLYLKYKDQGFQFIAVSIDGPESIAQVQNYVRKFGYTFPVVLDSETAILERYNPRGDVPFSMVVNRRGHVVDKHQGYNPGDEVPLEAKLKTLLAEAGPAVAQPTETKIKWWPTEDAQLDGTQSLRYRYLHDNANNSDTDDGVHGIFNRLTLNAVTDPFRLGVRIDNTLFPGYECEPGGDCHWEGDHRIERYWMQYKNRAVELRGGDFYHSMGRGLVFSIRKIDELGVDTTVRGGFARGTIGPVTLTGFGGLSNIKNVDTVFDQGLIPDPDDLITGGEATLALPDNQAWSVRTLYVDYKTPEVKSGDFDLHERLSDLVIGTSYSAPKLTENVSLYVEGAFINKYETGRLLEIDPVKGPTVQELNRDKSGYAAYTSLSITPAEGWAVLLEGKAYSRFEVRNTYETYGVALPTLYHEPPTLERFDQQVPGNRNSVGGRLRLEYYHKPWGMLFFTNTTGYSYADEGAEKDLDRYDWVDTFGDDGNWMLHTYGGLEKRWTGGTFVQVSGGWRNEAPNKPDDGALAYTRRLWHVESDVQVPLKGKHGLGLRTNHRNETKLLGQDEKSFYRGDANLTYSFAPQLSLALIWSYQSEFADASKFNNFAGEVFYRFSKWGQLSVFGGRVPAGIICVSGVCRELPSFTGIKSEFVARF